MRFLVDMCMDVRVAQWPDGMMTPHERRYV